MSRLSPHCPQLPEATRVWKNEEGVRQLRPLKTAAAWPAEPWRAAGGVFKNSGQKSSKLNKNYKLRKTQRTLHTRTPKKTTAKESEPRCPGPGAGEARRGSRGEEGRLSDAFRGESAGPGGLVHRRRPSTAQGPRRASDTERSRPGAVEAPGPAGGKQGGRRLRLRRGAGGACGAGSPTSRSLFSPAS